MSLQPASPLPWKVGFGHDSVRCDWWNRFPGAIPVVAPAGSFAFGAAVVLADKAEDARYIVTACNLFPELVEALKLIVDDAIDTDHQNEMSVTWAVINDVKAVLAKVRD